jgi:hypothetical protein
VVVDAISARIVSSPAAIEMPPVVFAGSKRTPAAAAAASASASSASASAKPSASAGDLSCGVTGHGRASIAGSEFDPGFAGCCHSPHTRCVHADFECSAHDLGGQIDLVFLISRSSTRVTAGHLASPTANRFCFTCTPSRYVGGRGLACDACECAKIGSDLKST